MIATARIPPGGIDRPLVITKNGVSVIPHQNWRGMFALGTNPAGGRDVPDIDWPGFHTTPWHGPARVVENWFGSLSTEMRSRWQRCLRSSTRPGLSA